MIYHQKFMHLFCTLSWRICLFIHFIKTNLLEGSYRINFLFLKLDDQLDYEQKLLHLPGTLLFHYKIHAQLFIFNFIYFHWSLYILYKFKGNKPEQIPMRVNRIMYTIFMLSNYHIITRLNTSWDHISINILIYQNHVYHSQTILCFSWQ
jgi:hypothetical protein